MLKEYPESLALPGFWFIQYPFKMQKKMTAPGLAHRKRSGETNPFEVNVSNAFEHYITWGLALPYPILKVQVI